MRNKKLLAKKFNSRTQKYSILQGEVICCCCCCGGVGDVHTTCTHSYIHTTGDIIKIEETKKERGIFGAENKREH